jgi:hypothetical protein
MPSGRENTSQHRPLSPWQNGVAERRVGSCRRDLPGSHYASGYTGDAILQQGVLEEGASFLAKRFTRDALAQKVREVLEAGRGTRVL